MKIITSMNDFESVTIRLSIPFKYDNKTIINIIVDHSEPLLIQSSVCIVPYRCKFYDDGYFQIDLINHDDRFKELMECIFIKILNKKKLKYLNTCVIRKFDQPFRLKNSDINTIQVYDSNKNKIHIKNITKHDAVKAIFQVEHIIVQDEDLSTSFGFKVFQIMKCNPSIDHYKETICLFDQGETNLLGRFQKMMSIGVPIEGIKHKMMMEGIVIDQIDSIVNKLNKSEEAKTHIHQDTKQVSETQKPIIPNLSFLSELRNHNEISLKKLEVPKKLVNKKILRCVDTSRKVPTLIEILKAKENLKSSSNIYVSKGESYL